MKNFELNQTINYVNGGPSVFTGIIKKIESNKLLVISDSPESLELWESGKAIGTDIYFDQIINPSI